jgi:hypothetical protein
MCLLSTRNHAFAKFMTQVIRLKVNYPEYRINKYLLLLNFHLEPLMIIVWLKKLKYNIMFHMHTQKMVWLNL